MARIGITAGAMDLLHAGHVLMLAECKRHCDHLIVCLQTDPTIDRPDKNKPVQSMFERYVQLKSCRYVDEIIPYDTEQDLRNILSTTPFDVRFIGDDWRGKEFTGHDIPDMQRRLFFNKRQHTYSSTELRERVKKS